MARTEHSALKMLTQLADKNLKQVGVSLGKASQAAQEAKSKYELLQGYRQDYITQLEPMLLAGLSADSYQNYNGFINKLNCTISSQQEVMLSAQQLVNVQSALWQQIKQKKRSYEVLAERYLKENIKLELGREQKLMDEFALRSGQRNPK